MKEVWEEYNDKATGETKLFFKSLILNVLATFSLLTLGIRQEKGAEDI